MFLTAEGEEHTEKRPDAGLDISLPRNAGVHHGGFRLDESLLKVLPEYNIIAPFQRQCLPFRLNSGIHSG